MALFLRVVMCAAVASLPSTAASGWALDAWCDGYVHYPAKAFYREHVVRPARRG